MGRVFKEKSDSIITMSELMLPSDANFGGKIHGGYILSLMDRIAFACASKHSGNYCVTASVNRVDFLNAVEIGELLTLKASVNFIGNTSMVIGIRVESENIVTGVKKHCNSSYFTMVAKSEDGKNVKVPGLILKSKDDVRRFVKSIKRQEHQKAREQEFKDTDFTSDKYVDLLASYNVKLER